MGAPQLLDLRSGDRSVVSPISAPGLFVGRHRELAALLAGLEDAMSGRGRMFLLDGEEGIGKTRLAEELADRARQRGAQVLASRCWEDGGAPPYWPWMQLLRSYGRGSEVDVLVSQVDAGAAVHGADPHVIGVGAARDARFRLCDAVTTFLGDAARAHPLVLILDNLQAADVASLLLLRFVADQLDELPILLVGIHRDREVGGLRSRSSAALERLSSQRVSQRLHLTGLAENDVARLIQHSTGIEPSAALAALVRGRTEGNPRFITEMVETLAAGGQLEEPLTTVSWHRAIPVEVHERISHRLSHLSPGCRRALSLAAVVGSEFRIDVLLHLAGGSVDELLTTLEEAATMRIIDDVPGRVGRLRFSDPTVRDVLYSELPATRRMRLHRDTGELLEAVNAPHSESHLAELARHFLASALPGCAEKAVRYAHRADELALHRVGGDIPVAHRSSASVFRRDGEYWSIAFDGDAFRLRDSKGLGYIAHLLARPGGELHPLAMAASRGLTPPGPGDVTRHRSGELDGDGPQDCGEVLDPQARAAYKNRLIDLRADLEEAESWADAGRAARVQDEIDFLAHQLSAALGLGGRARRMGSPAERARQSVTKAIKAALDRIERHSPALGRHLASTLHTGTFCSYTPDPRLPTAWEL